METVAVVLEGPEQLSLRSLALHDPTPNDVVVDVSFSGISTGTERLLYSGRMPPFPGMGYPLVPGYESVGVVVEAGSASGHRVGDTVFVPGSSAFKDARGLFGGAARRLITPASRVISLEPSLAEQGVLIALAATAYHAFAGGPAPELIVGHGVLGRLLARITVAQGAPPPVVWEKNADRRDGAQGYSVVDPDADTRRDYGAILDASGDATLLDGLVGRLAKGGEICLAGFYDEIRFTFPPAFMREARLRIASEWAPSDLIATMEMVASGRLSLDGLITHHGTPQHANDAYRTAFSEPACLKMILDWRQCA